MATEQKGFIVYGNHEEILDRLTDEEAGRLLKGMVRYFNHGTEPDFDGVLEFVWIPIRQQMDANAEKYEKKCQKNRESIQQYWDKVKSNTNEYERIRTNTNATNIDIDIGMDIDKEIEIESVPDAGLLSFDLIQYLNEKTGSDYKADKANADRVRSLLEQRYTPDQIRSVIDKKCAEWMGDEKMRAYLRPSTLWGAKFPEYVSAPVSIVQERKQTEADKRERLQTELDQKRRTLADLRESLSVADKTERRQLREQIALLEDSIGVIEGRLKCWPA